MTRFNLIAILFFSLSVMYSCKTSIKQKVNVDDLVAQMTLQEKLEFIGGYDNFYIRGIEHLGIPQVRMADGPVGVRDPGPSTAFPASITLAASFDKDLSRKVGKAIATEARSKNVHIMLGPAMNIHRAPFCGRNFEYLGEDPYLAGKIAAAYTKGIQGEGVIACAKHYAANYQDFNRHHVSSNIDERTLHEIYLPAFKATVEEGGVATIMTAYNLINGEHASQNDYLNNQVLKGIWGFKGFIMSDWVSTYDGIACAKGGLDLEMPSGRFMNPDTLRPAIESGLISESLIDDKVKRILTVYNQFGLLENANIAEGCVVDSVLNRTVALDAARGGIVLLKNETNFLPLEKGKVKSIAVIGPNGFPAVTGAGGSSYVKSIYKSSVFEAIKQKGGEGIDVTYTKGVYMGELLPEDFFDHFDFYTKEDGVKQQGVNAQYYNNADLKGDVFASKHFNKLNIDKEAMKIENLSDENFSVRFNCYFSPAETGSYWMAVAGDDGYRLYIDGELLIEQWQNQGETIRRYEGDFIKGKEYKIEVEYYQGGGGAVIRLAAQKRQEKAAGSESFLDEAIVAASKADVVVVCAGFNKDTEGEGADRSFELPYEQSEMIAKLCDTNPNVIVVLNAGGNVDMSLWIDKVKGLFHAWYPGQEGALAVAEMLFGETNPSGKLPVSFEKKWADSPAFNSYFDDDNDLNVDLSEGIFMGYRHYDQSDVKPRFPFGFGLSYTSFEFDNVKSDRQIIKANEQFKFSVDVTNNGVADGAEVVQVYVSDKESSLPRPIKELKAFEKVFLKKGETKTVEFELNPNAFSFYDSTKHEWIIEPGEFEILIGNSSVDIHKTFNLVVE